MSQTISLSDDPLATLRQVEHVLRGYGIRIKELEINRYAAFKLFSSPDAIKCVNLSFAQERGYVGEICGIPFTESP